MTDAEELERRMAGPHRHRLLQGYPMLPLLRPAVSEPGRHRRLDGALCSDVKEAVLPRARVAPQTLAPPHLTLDGKRPLIIGLIPHTACNPRVEGCGFCTFPHDHYDKSNVRYVVGRVERELESLYLGLRTDAGLPLTALYRLRPPSTALWVERGWVQVGEQRLVCRPEGWLRLDALVRDLTGAGQAV
jgi:hypothetical protein